jgi:predicted DNA-binding transcriptional regulator YafY
MWYAVALCEQSARARVCRLDRVARAEPLDAPLDAPHDVSATFSVDEVLQGGKVLAGEASRTMTVRYSPRIARWVAEREGKPLAADGSLTLEHPVADDAWAVRHVLQYGPEAELLEPADLRALLAERLNAIRLSMATA